MIGLSEVAFAVMAACGKNQQNYGITIDLVSRNVYKFVWAFKIDKEKARREGYDTTQVRGAIILDEGFMGCPYCGQKKHIVCSHCNRFFCYHNQEVVMCPHCGASGKVTDVEEISLNGSGY